MKILTSVVYYSYTGPGLKQTGNTRKCPRHLLTWYTLRLLCLFNEILPLRALYGTWRRRWKSVMLVCRKVSNKHTIKRNYCAAARFLLYCVAAACYGNFSLSMCSLLNEKCIDAARSTVLHNTRSSSQISFNAHSFQSIIISKRLMRWTWYLYIWAAQWICVIYLCWCHRDHFAKSVYTVVRWSYYSC